MLGSFLNARSKRDLTTAPRYGELAGDKTFEEPVISTGPTVGRAWELDTFTAPVRGRELGAWEKLGLVVTVVGVAVLAMLMLRPVPLRDDTRQFVQLAATAPTSAEETSAGFAKAFLMDLGAEWDARIFFQNVLPDFWPSSPRGANTLAEHYAQGFAALREHGRVTGVDIQAPRARANADPAGREETLPCTLELADGTALRGSVRVSRAVGSVRWSVCRLSILPVLP